ncbi:putative protein disulfide-isomerase [Smittium culicis]|uniref:Thioredoxin domain-containing protein n=2 Tax=Smittium culicis TaxID=133412 RepID=A0A1R1Y835_9FUNG|nr:putative protein disulfide-isomerase [Smittium culicis]
MTTATTAAAESLYQGKTYVKEITDRNFDKLVHNSRYPVVVEFYAPWCGHCKSLAPIYKRAAQKARSYAKFYAVNCDEDINKSLCGKYGVKGFPTVKGFFVPKDGSLGNKTPVDYNGPREIPQLLEFSESRLRYSAVALKPESIDDLISQFDTKFEQNDSDAQKRSVAVLFTNKNKIPNMWKGISNGSYGKINLGVVSASKYESLAKDDLGLTEFPSIVVFKANTDGSYSKDNVSRFADEFSYDNIVAFMRTHFVGTKSADEPSNKSSENVKNSEEKKETSQEKKKQEKPKTRKEEL